MKIDNIEFKTTGKIFTWNQIMEHLIKCSSGGWWLESGKLKRYYAKRKCRH